MGEVNGEQCIGLKPYSILILHYVRLGFGAPYSPSIELVLNQGAHLVVKENKKSLILPSHCAKSAPSCQIFTVLCIRSSAG